MHVRLGAADLWCYRNWRDMVVGVSFITARSNALRPMVEVRLQDAWVWDMYRKSRFVPTVRVVTFKDVNIEELPKSDLEPPA